MCLFGSEINLNANVYEKLKSITKDEKITKAELQELKKEIDEEGITLDEKKLLLELFSGEKDQEGNHTIRIKNSDMEVCTVKFKKCVDDYTTGKQAFTQNILDEINKGHKEKLKKKQEEHLKSLGRIEDTIGDNVIEKFKDISKDGLISQEELEDLVNIINSDGKISAAEQDLLNTLQKMNQYGTKIDFVGNGVKFNKVRLAIEKDKDYDGKELFYENKYKLINIPSKPLTESQYGEEVSSKNFEKALVNCDIYSLLNSKIGSNMLSILGITDDIKLINMTEAQKSTLAFNFAMLESRNQFYKIYKSPPTDTEGHKEYIRSHPDKSMEDKIEELGKIFNMDRKKAIEFLTNSDFQKSLINKFEEMAKKYYEALGGKDNMPHQFLAATGDFSRTAGLANSKDGICSGYFMYKPTAFENSISMKVPKDKDLEINISSYGFDSSTKKTMEINLVNNKGVTQTLTFEISRDEGIVLKKPDKVPDGIKLNNKNQNLIFDYKIFADYKVMVNIDASGNMDETQIHISTNSEIDINPNNLKLANFYDSNKYIMNFEQSKNFKKQEDFLKARSLLLESDKIIATGHGMHPDIEKPNDGNPRPENRRTDVSLKDGTFLLDSYTDSNVVSNTKYNCKSLSEMLGIGHNDQLSTLRALSTLYELVKDSKNSLDSQEYNKLLQKEVTIKMDGRDYKAEKVMKLSELIYIFEKINYSNQ